MLSWFDYKWANSEGFMSCMRALDHIITVSGARTIYHKTLERDLTGFWHTSWLNTWLDDKSQSNEPYYLKL